MILKKKFDGKSKIVLNKKNYWTHYRKMPNVLFLTKLVKVTQITDADELRNLAAQLKRRCGTGGSVADNGTKYRRHPMVHLYV
jgi:hypothetical protein